MCMAVPWQVLIQHSGENSFGFLSKVCPMNVASYSLDYVLLDIHYPPCLIGAS